MTTTDRQDVLIVAVVKGAERYVIAYDHDSRRDALHTLGRWANDKRLSFNWVDAAQAGKQVGTK